MPFGPARAGTLGERPLARVRRRRRAGQDGLTRGRAQGVARIGATGHALGGGFRAWFDSPPQRLGVQRFERFRGERGSLLADVLPHPGDGRPVGADRGSGPFAAGGDGREGFRALAGVDGTERFTADDRFRRVFVGGFGAVVVAAADEHRAVAVEVADGDLEGRRAWRRGLEPLAFFFFELRICDEVRDRRRDERHLVAVGADRRAAGRAGARRRSGAAVFQRRSGAARRRDHGEGAFRGGAGAHVADVHVHRFPFRSHVGPAVGDGGQARRLRWS